MFIDRRCYHLAVRTVTGKASVGRVSAAGIFFFYQIPFENAVWGVTGEHDKR